MTRRLVVVGGGVAGLAGARRARLDAERGGIPLRITVLEAAPRLGGKVWTERADGVPLEWGPDSFLAAKPRGRDLAEELGLGPELVAPGPAASRAYLLLGGRLRRLPPGLALGLPRGASTLVAAVREGILTPWGALRAALEPLLPRSSGPDRSVAESTARRLGPEAARRLVAPLVAGVYGAPPERLGMAAVFPQLWGARSLALAARRTPRGEGPVFLTPRGGMGRLVERLAEGLDDVRIAAPAAVLRMGDGPSVRTGDEELRADAVLVAVPSPAAADLLEAEMPEAARLLRRIEWVPSAVVHLRYEPSVVRRPLDAAGYLVAPEEPGLVAACSWIPAKWPHLAASGVRLRAVVTGRAAVALDEGALAARAAEEVGAAVAAAGPPVETRVRRWERAMPVYAPGHLDRVAAIRRSLPRDIEVAGASYGGVGVPDCIRDGEEAAARLVGALEP